MGFRSVSAIAGGFFFSFVSWTFRKAFRRGTLSVSAGQGVSGVRTKGLESGCAVQARLYDGQMAWVAGIASRLTAAGARVNVFCLDDTPVTSITGHAV